MKKVILIIGSIISSLIIAAGIVFIVPFTALTYELEFKITFVEECKSPDGQYELVINQLGEPFFFESANGIFILRKDGRNIAREDFSVQNDGGWIDEDSCDVRWLDDCVVVTVHGCEQKDKDYILEY